MSEYFTKPNSLGANVKVELELSNYATKTDLKNAAGVDTLSFTKNVDLANLQFDVDKLDIDKLVPIPVDLSKLKDVYNAKIKSIEDNIPDITNLAANASLNAKINEIKGEIPSITNLATTAALTIVEKIPNVSNLVKKLTITQKLIKLKRKF